MAKAKKKKATALVLQGGGALGAYEYGVVKALYENSDFSPDIVCGVSIGGFSAAVIGGAKEGPVKGLEQLWDMFTALNIPFVPHPLQVLMSIPYNHGMYVPNYSAAFAPLSATHFFDTKPLYKTLENIIDFEKLNASSSPNVVIGATNVEKGIGEEFNNRQMALSTKHIVSSGSLPPSFPMVNINGQYYWDGGLFSNTPLKPALKALEKFGNDQYEKELIMVELFPQESPIPNNMPDVLERVGSLTFESKIVFDQKLFNRTKDYIDFMEKLDKELPKGSKIRKTAGFKQLNSYNKIDKLTVIKYTGEENVLGIADFTQQTIERRIALGYQDGLKHLEKP